MPNSKGNLSVEAKNRYGFIRAQLLADFPPPARVVEFGSAPGDQIAALAELGYRATSLDLGEVADDWGSGEVGRMRRPLESAGVADVQWDLEKTPYPLGDQVFDAVIMTEVYEHLRDYPIRALTEAHRVLVPGGRLYFTTPNAAYIINRANLARGKSTATPLHDWIGGLPHARHAREYTFAEVDELMARVGLAVTTRTSRQFYINSGRQSAFAKAAKMSISLLAAKRPTLGPSIVIVAERRGSSGTASG